MLWHEHLRRTAKLLIVGSLYYGGVLGYVRKRLTESRALILMYHRVTPADRGVPDYSPNGIAVTPAQFAMQMQFLLGHYDVVPLSRIVAAIRGEQAFTPGLCAVTFDDGWQDVYEHAFPILTQYSIPATVFLTTGFVDGGHWFWEERFKYLMALLHQRARQPWYAHASATLAGTALASHGLDGTLRLRPSRLANYLLQRATEIKSWEPARRLQMMRELETLAAQIAPDASRPFMTWAEVCEMAQYRVEFGNHSVSHPIIPELSESEAREEIEGAANRIREQLGRAPVAFAFPYGKFDDRVCRLARQAGAESACTTRLGLVEHDADPFALNRINMCSDVAGLLPLFAARIMGF